MEKKNKHKRLSISDVRSFKEFAGYTNEQAEGLINSLEKLSVLFFELFQKHKQLFKKENIEPINLQKHKTYDYEEPQRNAA
jgi:hypothetical protein